MNASRWVNAAALASVLAAVPMGQAVVASSPQVAVVASAPTATTRACATYTDYKRLRLGQTQTRVNRLLHSRGQVIDHRVWVGAGGGSRLSMIVRYPTCTRGRFLGVTLSEDRSKALPDGRVVLTLRARWWLS